MAKKSKKTVRRPHQLHGKKKTAPKKNGLFLAGVFVLAFILIVIFMYRDRMSAPSKYFIKIVSQFTGDNQACGTFHAWDLTLADNQSIVLSDQGTARILYFDKDGKFEREVTQEDAGPPKFKEISGITSDEKGNVYVIDAWNGLVRGFSPKGKPTFQVELSNVYGPRGVAWDKSFFVVVDTGTSRLLKVNPDGKVIKAWGKLDDGRSLFDNPMAVSVDAQGLYYVADTRNKRIQCLNAEGTPIRQYKMGAPPSRVTVDSKNGLVYATSLEGGFTQVFSVSGKNLGKLVDIYKPDQPLKGINGLRVAEDGKLVAAFDKDVKFFQHIQK